ncbi:MAG: Acetyl esterase [bacterium]|nr:Acetyl esterase [bacterium]
MFKQFLQPVWFVLMFSIAVFGQTLAPDAATWVAEIGARYYVVPNLTYLAADNYEAKLDVYVSRSASATAPVPTVIFIHGGGWEGGDKNAMVLRLLPYLEMGWSAVNVNYRAGPATAPAAVEDCRCALRWVIRNAQKYNFDVNKLIVTGESAGSHLALTTGMLPASAGLDGECSGAEELKVAAIINWYGVTDVVDVFEGANQQGFAVRWLSGLPNPKELAQRVSPLQYVRPGLPVILTIHGDADQVAPYSHAVRLHQALDDAKVPNQLLTIPGGTHGGFKRDEFIMIYATIREFLQKHGIVKST